MVKNIFINADARDGLAGQDITYKTGIHLAELLVNDPRFDVFVNRPAGSAITGTNNKNFLARCVYQASIWPADCFININVNANVNPLVKGTEVYVYQTFSEAYWLAEHILINIVNTAGTDNNDIRIDKSSYVLRKNSIPAVLVELAYLTNDEDAEKLNNNPYAFAYGIYLGLLEYFDFKLLS